MIRYFDSLFDRLVALNEPPPQPPLEAAPEAGEPEIPSKPSLDVYLALTYATVRNYIANNESLSRPLRKLEWIIAWRYWIHAIVAHTAISLVIFAHFFLLQYFNRAAQALDSRFYWARRIIPSLEFGSMHAVLFQLALLPITMARHLVTTSGLISTSSLYFVHIHLGYTVCVTIIVAIVIVIIFFGGEPHRRGDQRGGRRAGLRAGVGGLGDAAACVIARKGIGVDCGRHDDEAQLRLGSRRSRHRWDGSGGGGASAAGWTGQGIDARPLGDQIDRTATAFLQQLLLLAYAHVAHGHVAHSHAPRSVGCTQSGGASVRTSGGSIDASASYQARIGGHVTLHLAGLQPHSPLEEEKQQIQIHVAFVRLRSRGRDGKEPRSVRPKPRGRAVCGRAKRGGSGGGRRGQARCISA
jgi:hypothetical protein